MGLMKSRSSTNAGHSLPSSVVITYTHPADRPQPSQVSLIGAFCGWDKERALPMALVSRDERRWAVPLTLPVVVDADSNNRDLVILYKFLVDGQWALDDVDAGKVRVTEPNDGYVNHQWVVPAAGGAPKSRPRAITTAGAPKTPSKLKRQLTEKCRVS